MSVQLSFVHYDRAVRSIDFLQNQRASFAEQLLQVTAQDACNQRDQIELARAHRHVCSNPGVVCGVVVQVVRPFRLEKDEVLFNEGDLGAALYFVGQGGLQVRDTGTTLTMLWTSQPPPALACLIDHGAIRLYASGLRDAVAQARCGHTGERGPG